MVLVTAAGAVPKGSPSVSYDVNEKSIAALQADLASGSVTAEDLTTAYLARIKSIDSSGVSLSSVIALNPRAMDEAREADANRRAGKVRGPLDGIPVLIKDNIESADGTATTAGSEALLANVTHRNAPVVQRLRNAGAVILGKTNLSEWANIRSSHSISGWSAVGGLVKNPYALDRNACGSSSGTGAAIAASLAAAGIGTETDGSVTCPAAMNGLVGLKPTVGLVSRTYIVPISHSQDTAGPMGRTVADVAALLNVMAGTDPRDAATKNADTYKRDYVTQLSSASLQGKRLGVLRFATGYSPPVDAVFERAVALLKANGAHIVELKTFKPDSRLGDAEQTVLLSELKVDLNAYLASTPPDVKTRTLSDVIAFNRAHSRELSLFGQDQFEKADATKGLDDPTYIKAHQISLRLARTEGIDKLIVADNLDALIAPSYGAAWRTDVVDGDNDLGSVSSLPAVAGYPHLTVPMGYVSGLPVGISFIGRAWTEQRLLNLGAAYEHASHARHAPTFMPSVETSAPIAPLLAPLQSSRDE
ncbi:MAG: amidase [Candidatus Eremiobacteraeota bacterium]|nr:amidase [Candidatus Eremiobacteraeota bacterium]MBC5822743.1 amidase [Candidatus Eremiobacteraeota bacterium]